LRRTSAGFGIVPGESTIEQARERNRGGLCKERVLQRFSEPGLTAPEIDVIENRRKADGPIHLA